MAVCTTLCLFGLYFESGKILELGALCHGLHPCSNGVVAHWLAIVSSALALMETVYYIECCNLV